MAQQIDDLHRPRRRRGDEFRPALRHRPQRRRAADINRKVAPFGDVFGDRLVERDAALLDEHHEGDGGDRLRHRIDAEDRVFLHRHVAFDVGEALHCRVNDLAVTVDDRVGAGETPVVHIVAREMVLELLQARARHSRAFRRSRTCGNEIQAGQLALPAFRLLPPVMSRGAAPAQAPPASSRASLPRPVSQSETKPPHLTAFPPLRTRQGGVQTSARLHAKRTSSGERGLRD